MNFSKENILQEINLDNITESAKNIINPILKNTEKKYMYKWRDAKGVIHYTSAKPAEHINVETIELSTETNVVPAISESNTNDGIREEVPVSSITNETTSDIYTVEGIERLVEQAKAIQNRPTDAND